MNDSKKLKINFVLPYFGSRAGGGLKVMYEYAKRLSNRGHDVVVYSSLKTNYESKYDKSDFFLKYKAYTKTLKGRQRPSWFDLPKNVICKMIPYVADQYIRDADVCISTWWATAHHISVLNIAKGLKFNLIQNYETIMTMESEKSVHDSFKLPIHQIVISPYLNNVVSLFTSSDIEYIPNAIDLRVYKITNPIDNRNPRSIIMRYSSSEYKACEYALEAFNELKKKYPDLIVILFSSEKRPDYIPSWITYVYGQSNITPFYNDAAIYVSSSIVEGWPLPPMEAMACGCTCVCTNIASHLSYMVDQENALLVNIKSSVEIVDKVSFLIDQSVSRISLAKRSNTFIQQYDWEISVNKMESVFYKYL